MRLYIKIGQLIYEKNMTIVAFSKKSGIPLSTLSGILQGKQIKNMSLRTTLAIADTLDMSIYDLIKGTEYEKNAYL
ncbi:MAG: helix-turn-helix transcriptional regulator [Peptoniphilus lacydonensis]|uniref:helix-turn-helix domain-containing protein n=1 Tax=Peptoniphilus lacydonensis TaxID=1673725 RepID=UPI002902D488|nr:helix-turn-helix transcriptional regulator [Peptoniphilus lacydonensis]MDU2116218.1 helix-turn-helix transcriptional regulator [Peptoniphilus lacydonensis]